MDKSAVISILKDLLTQLSLPFSDATAAEDGDILRVDIVSPIPSKIIGWHGETLNSLQHVVKAIMRTKEKMERSPFIVLDTDGYRRMQEEKVRKVAEQKADFVRRTGNRVALPPMSPYFRRIVHLHIANTPTLTDIQSESSGEGDYRQVVLRLKNEKGRPASKEDAPSEELSPVMASDDGLENLDI